MKKINLKELALGTKFESFQTQDRALAEKIAMRNLQEDEGYYNKLQAAGLEDELSEPEVAPVADVAVAVVAAPEVAGQKALASSGLGSPRTQKPLSSDKLTAPKTNVINNKNTVASTKTPALGGSTIHTDTTDQFDHFGGQIANVLGNIQEDKQSEEREEEKHEERRQERKATEKAEDKRREEEAAEEDAK